jgi:hypothetical protein
MNFPSGFAIVELWNFEAELCGPTAGQKSSESVEAVTMPFARKRADQNGAVQTVWLYEVAQALATAPMPSQ